jgi:DNA (cytosine-5)-methyltransferase 1
LFSFCSCSLGLGLAAFQKTTQRKNCAVLEDLTFSEVRRMTGMSVEEVARELQCCSSTVYRWERGEIEPKATVLRILRQIAKYGTESASGPAHFDFVDLFAGIGGLRTAFNTIGGHCVFTSEYNRFAQQTYTANFRDNRPIYGDITKLSDLNEIPEHDVLLAGFPCQPFSIAGVSKKNALGRNHGFACEAQGTLFFDVARILDAKRPAAFLLENVKNLESHDKKRTFEIILRTLREELGYNVWAKVIDAQHFLPQHRERIVIVGFRDKVPFTWDDLDLPAKGSMRMRDILHPEDGSERVEEPYTLGPRGCVNDKYTLTDKLWRYLQDYAAKHRAKGNGFGFGLVGPDDVSRTLSARYFKDGSEILVSRGNGQNPRRLTPRECARLMGYPDDFKIPVSDTQAYKQFGNSVAVPVFREVARIMHPHIEEAMKRSERLRAA